MSDLSREAREAADAQDHMAAGSAEDRTHWHHVYLRDLLRRLAAALEPTPDLEAVARSRASAAAMLRMRRLGSDAGGVREGGGRRSRQSRGQERRSLLAIETDSRRPARRERGNMSEADVPLERIRRSFPVWSGEYRWSVAEVAQLMPSRIDAERFAAEGAHYVSFLSLANRPCCYDEEYQIMLCRGWDCSFRRNYFGVP